MVGLVKSEVRASFRDSDVLLDAVVLGHFFKNFAVLHNAIASLAEKDDHTLAAASWPAEELARLRYSDLWTREWIYKVAHEYFVEHGRYRDHARLEEDPKWLQIGAISKQSPFDVVMVGIPIALTAAAIFLGGRIKITSVFEAELPPLGEGLRAIRQAMQIGNRRR